MSATPFKLMQINLAGEQDDKTARLVRGPNVLRSTVNSDHGHRGELRKRRGYTHLDTTSTPSGQVPESLFMTIAVDGEELVLVGRDNVYGLPAPDELISGSALIFRGPSLVGNYKVYSVHTSALAEG